MNRGARGASKDLALAESVMFVPATPLSELLHALRKADREFVKLYGSKPIKFAERTGRKIAHALSSTDLWGKLSCGRVNCLPCGVTGGN